MSKKNLKEEKEKKETITDDNKKVEDDPKPEEIEMNIVDKFIVGDMDAVNAEIHKNVVSTVAKFVNEPAAEPNADEKPKED